MFTKIPRMFLCIPVLFTLLVPISIKAENDENPSMIRSLAKLRHATTKRFSSWNATGENKDFWRIQPGGSKILADIKGPGCITHIWMTQANHYRECLIKITWDDAESPSVLCPLGDFFGLGHSIVNSYQSLLFSASTAKNNELNKGCALNCYVQMPFKKHAVIELVNQSNELHNQYFYVDYEVYDEPLAKEEGYFHAEFRRENPFGGWGDEIPMNVPEINNVPNKEKTAWDNNYVILETKGRGHYIGCNLSVTNFHADSHAMWWGEGDDMIWVDGYKWPPDLHGTGSEDYLNQAWFMQPNAFLRNGSSIYEKDTNGYQTSYVYHLENPVHFQKEIKVTIEHGHANHLRNEMSSVAYWYADKPYPAVEVPPVAKRLPVMRDEVSHHWLNDKLDQQNTSREIQPNQEMLDAKEKWKEKQKEIKK